METESKSDSRFIDFQINIKTNCYPISPKKVLKELTNLKKDQTIKLLLSLFIIICFGIFNNINIIGNPLPKNKGNKHCYEDAVLDFFKFLNNFWIDNKYYRTFFEISGSIFLDILFFVSYIGWAIYSVDWRYGVSTMLFYGIRGILQTILRMCLPDDLYFPDPGFPSVVVSYVQGSDFFFSGHCGFPIVVAYEFTKMKKYKFAYFCYFVAIWEGFLMINSREHYTIDLIVGPIFAHYICMNNFEWFKSIYNIKFLNKLKLRNREELKRIDVDFDIDE